MSGLDMRRVGGVAGIVAMALVTIGFLLPGAPPKADDSAQSVSDFLIDKRGDLLTGSFLIGLGSALLVVWLAALWCHLTRADGDRVLSVAALAAGVVTGSINMVGAATLAGSVFEAARLKDVTLNRAAFDIATAMFTIAGFTIAVLFAAASAAGSKAGALPNWLVWFGYLAAVVQVISVLAIGVDSGFFAGGGGMAFIAFIAAVLWVVAVSVLLVRGDGDTSTV